MNIKRAGVVGLLAAVSLGASATAQPERAPAGEERPARERAAVAVVDVPLPEGGNLNGIRWESTPGSISDTDVRFVVSYNATCQWWRALQERRQTIKARAVIREAPSWPAFAGTEVAESLRLAAADLDGGHPGPRARAMLEQCAASKLDEQAHAKQRGLTPGV